MYLHTCTAYGHVSFAISSTSRDLTHTCASYVLSLSSHTGTYNTPSYLRGTRYRYVIPSTYYNTDERDSYSEMALLRGTIVNRTYGTHKNLRVSVFFTNNIWSRLLWSPVIDTDKAAISIGAVCIGRGTISIGRQIAAAWPTKFWRGQQLVTTLGLLFSLKHHPAISAALYTPPSLTPAPALHRKLNQLIEAVLRMQETRLTSGS